MTKIPSVEERQKEYEKLMVEIERISAHEDNGEALESHREAFRDFLTADRLTLLAAFNEWVEIKKLDATVMNVANRKRAGHINRTLVEVQAHINNLINPGV